MEVSESAVSNSRGTLNDMSKPVAVFFFYLKDYHIHQVFLSKNQIGQEGVLVSKKSIASFLLDIWLKFSDLDFLLQCFFCNCLLHKPP